jgi:hypothetical protein
MSASPVLRRAGEVRIWDDDGCGWWRALLCAESDEATLDRSADPGLALA